MGCQLCTQWCGISLLLCWLPIRKRHFCVTGEQWWCDCVPRLPLQGLLVQRKWKERERERESPTVEAGRAAHSPDGRQVQRKSNVVYPAHGGFQLGWFFSSYHIGCQGRCSSRSDSAPNTTSAFSGSSTLLLGSAGWRQSPVRAFWEMEHLKPKVNYEKQ